MSYPIVQAVVMCIKIKHSQASLKDGGGLIIGHSEGRGNAFAVSTVFPKHKTI